MMEFVRCVLCTVKVRVKRNTQCLIGAAYSSNRNIVGILSVLYMQRAIIAMIGRLEEAIGSIVLGSDKV